MGDTRYRNKKKALGLCVNCVRPAVKGRTRCQECLERDNNYQNERRRNMVKNNRCVQCGTPVKSGTRCKVCAQKKRSSIKERLSNIKRKKGIAEYRRANRLCTHCGVALLDDEGATCINCSSMNKYMEAGKWKEF